MKYRVATAQDLESATECIASTGYFNEVRAEALDGVLIVAVQDGRVMSTVWAMVCGRHAYVDYLSVRPELQGTGIGVRMLYKLYQYLRKVGILYARSHIHGSNMEVCKVAAKMGSVLDAPYVVTHTYLGDKNG